MEKYGEGDEEVPDFRVIYRDLEYLEE